MVPQDGGKVPIEVVVRGSGDSSRGKMAKMGRNLVVFGLYGVKINRPEASPPHTNVLGSENGENFVGLGVHQQGFGKKLARNVQNALPG